MKQFSAPYWPVAVLKKTLSLHFAGGGVVQCALLMSPWSPSFFFLLLSYSTDSCGLYTGKSRDILCALRGLCASRSSGLQSLQVKKGRGERKTHSTAKIMLRAGERGGQQKFTRHPSAAAPTADTKRAKVTTSTSAPRKRAAAPMCDGGRWIRLQQIFWPCIAKEPTISFE